MFMVVAISEFFEGRLDFKIKKKISMLAKCVTQNQ